MREQEFIETVRQEAPLETDDAAREFSEATLRTLGERITDGQAADLATALPDDVASPLEDAGGEAESFPLDEAVDRIAERAEIEEPDVPVVTHAVFAAVAETAGDELDGGREQLPPAFDLLFEPGSLTREAPFVKAVANRAELSNDEAREASEAVLRALGEALTEGQAADLAMYLPDPFATAITDPGADAADLSVAEFLDRVADREGVDEDTAEPHARAVLGAVSEATSERELDDAKKQLPDEFGGLFGA